MKHIRPPIPQHRLERFATWSRLMLVWFAGIFAGAWPHARRLRRYGDLTLDRLATEIATLIYLRAANRVNLHARPRKRLRVFAVRGFNQRSRPKNLARAARGAWLRKHLRHRDPVARISILLHALANIDAYAARIMPRLKRRLTRLCARVIAAPPAHAVRSLAIADIRAADSS